MYRGCIVAANIAVLCVLAFARTEYFSPAHRLSGVGVSRSDITPEVLAARTGRMIESQTFAIMRDPVALTGAQRISSPRLQQAFRSASVETGIPASLLSAIAYLESWGDSRAESPAGPKGIMQFAEATARANGLRIVYATHYKTTRDKRLVKKAKGKPVYKTVVHRTAFQVKVRDDRFLPDRAVFAAARYLARMEDKFGGRDWAVFAYHCGEGCVMELQALAREALGQHQDFTVAAMFFAASPASHRDLYEALQRHMQRDFSPTYWFRVKRAEELLHLYQTEPAEFRKLVEQYRNPLNPERRANDRLVVWLRSDEMLYQNCDDLRRATGKQLVPVFQNPDFFGFSVNATGSRPLFSRDPDTRDLYLQASPAAIGTLSYISFETRRLFDAMKPKGEQFVPLNVAELVNTKDTAMQANYRGAGQELPQHCTGQVFDLDLSGMPKGEREALSFVLDELGWDGYLGFIQISGDTLHIGSSPSARDFFAQVFQDAVEAEK